MAYLNSAAVRGLCSGGGGDSMQRGDSHRLRGRAVLRTLSEADIPSNRPRPTPRGQRVEETVPPCSYPVQISSHPRFVSSRLCRVNAA